VKGQLDGVQFNGSKAFQEDGKSDREPPYTPLGRGEWQRNKPSIGSRGVVPAEANDPVLACDPQGLFLERFRRRQNAFDPRCRSGRVRGSLFASRANARGLGLLRLIPTSCQRLRETFPDEADDAGPRLGGDKANGTVLGNQMKLVATNATMIVLKDTGHWVLEERPKETMDALMKFL
jgi:pimeloyl-ACP methyl ester carboxylesterase